MSGDTLGKIGEPPEESAPTPPKKTKQTRRSQLTITGGIVPPESIRPHQNHPLGHMSPVERLDAAYQALGGLVLRIIEGSTSTHTE